MGLVISAASAFAAGGGGEVPRPVENPGASDPLADRLVWGEEEEDSKMVEMEFKCQPLAVLCGRRSAGTFTFLLANII